MSPDRSPRFELELAVGVEAAREALQTGDFDLVLFDLARGDQDLFALAALLNRNLDAHVLALVPAGQEEAGRRARKMGAAQYCIKEQLLADAILCISQFLTRRGAAAPLQETQARPQRQLELFQDRAGRERKRSGEAAEVDAGEEQERLRSRDPETFQQLVRRFGDVLELALERVVYKVKIDTSNTLRLLAEELGLLQATPRDLVEVYATCLQQKRPKANDQRYAGYVEEGRLLLIETMGYLVNFYRTLALAVTAGDAPPAGISDDQE